MSEEIIEPSETTSTETNNEPSPQETSTGIDYDKLENDFLGIKPEETTEVEESVTETKETTDDNKGEVKPEKYTFKANGKDVELEIKDEAQKVDLIRKGYTFDENMREHSEKVKTFESERESFQKERELIQLENLAWQIGGVMKEPVLDVYGDAYDNMVAKYGKEQADKYLETHELVGDTADYAMKQQRYNGWTREAQTLLQNREQATKTNEKNIESFKTKYKLDDYQVTEVIKQASDYLGYAVSKGQKPFPENAFEVFYRGMNFDTLLKSETEKLNADWEKKFKDEREKLITEFSGKKPKPKPAPVKKSSDTQTTDKTWIDEMEDRIVGIN